MQFVISDGEIKDGAAGFSAGQKQLLGLARAILHKTKLIIMDEATSSVDLQTETTLLQVVNDVFKDSTVLTIAVRSKHFPCTVKIRYLNADFFIILASFRYNYRRGSCACTRRRAFG